MIVKSYEEDLSYIHDVGFGFHATQAAPGLLEILAAGGVERGWVVDLGCGSGIWARALCDAGYDVLGVDISKWMLAMARKREPRARFLRSSLFDTDLPDCDAVTATGECFNYTFDGKSGKSGLRTLFRRVHAALRPGGLFVFDLATPERGKGRGQAFWEGKDWTILVDFDSTKDSLTRNITTFRKVGSRYRRATEVHRQRLYEPAQIEQALRRTGFRVRRVRGYGEFRFPDGLVGLIARKP